ncbi:DUF2614 family zinc ribbon-containing protein [Staphylococcus carnosus]|uniref:DUF2614 family zinc ribbon-containing protein n=1 Tax=Staphylococcus carnosus TaxID=1281 RepID=UPI00081A7FBB|nr:DUF2614 family zinc ribbon-containing protein [Staphylococcus carnosus]ANZ33907.1 hypothetical protein BEK99_08950 [Staphylococcus carnosus]UTB86088.1 hypothetical protein A2I66_10550 [Staphylococcus carnosus]
MGKKSGFSIDFDEKKFKKDLEKAARYIEMHCPSCGKKFKVDTKKRMDKCPKCKEPIKIKK